MYNVIPVLDPLYLWKMVLKLCMSQEPTNYTNE